jgi:beta-glucosidase
VPAIVSAWFPGEEGGNAIASAIFGDQSPGGRAPASFPSHPGSLPAPYNHTRTTGSSYYDGGHEPVFPFGHGLTYTTFEYTDLRVSADERSTNGDPVEISCRVTNTGTCEADEVVQLYVRDPVARTARPRRELKGFRRVTLAPGASVDVTFELATDRVCLYDPPLGWVVEPGVIEVMVGASSEDLRLRGQFTLTGSARVIDGDRVLTTPVRLS